MAVVVSQPQNEIEEFKKKGLDIATHRKRMVNHTLMQTIARARRPSKRRRSSAWESAWTR
jgi:type I restriction enzyme, R subunit